jgi:hemolysin activation/secretion protein
MRRSGFAHSAASSLFLALCFAAPWRDVLAAEQTVPNAGVILQQAQSLNLFTPTPSASGVAFERERAVKPISSAPFLVKKVLLTGQSLFDSSTLHALVSDVEGKSLTLAQLDESVGRITEFYHSHGYPLSRAVIPAQTIQTGTVNIQIIEARYASITVDNHSRVNGLLFERTLSSLKQGQPVQQAQLERAVLLASDIPGVVVSSTLKPGDTLGTSSIDINVNTASQLTGSVTADNDGNQYTGKVRLGATVNAINPLHNGDVFSVSALSTGSAMNYANLAYETLATGEGTRVGLSYSALHYVLGNSLADIDAHGRAQVGSVWVKQPIVRSLAFNLYGQIQYDHKQLDDEIDVAAIRTDRRLNSWTVSLYGDSRDALLSGGVNTWNVGWVGAARLAFDNAAAQSVDASSANTQGKFSILDASLSRLQNLDAKNALYVRLSGQLASKNLDQSDKLLAGGVYTVRAYDIGAVTGDTGLFGSAEYRHDFGAVWEGQLRGIAFFDSEHVTVNKNTWVAGANSATLSGAGIGFDWAGPDQWSARASIATPIGPKPALVGNDKSVRAWAEVDKGF